MNIEKKELEQAYFLLNGLVANGEDQDDERSYLLELQRWFIDKFEEFDQEKNNIQTLHVKPCHNTEFHKIDCLEMEDELGFFNTYNDEGHNDPRPGHAIWIEKKDAERLYSLFSKEERSS